MTGRKDLFKLIETRMATDQREKRIWMHCASLGEFEQGRPVIEALRVRYPECSIIVTFFSSSGFEVRKNYKGANHIFYLPVDSPSNARRFLDIVKPSIAIWVKYEYWYFYLKRLHELQVPLLLVSANFIRSQVFFKWYGGLHRQMLAFFSMIFVQSEASASILKTIDVDKQVIVSGDTRFDRVNDIVKNFQPLQEIRRFCVDAPVIVAGSTWQEDEEELDHYANTHPDIRFIIAPHEITPERIEEVKKLFKHAIVYSAFREEGELHKLESTQGIPANVLIIDNIGLLSRLYHYATVAYVGGGFGDEGVHNVLEAAVYGKPVVYGPVFEKFIEAQELINSGGGFIINSALELEQVMGRLLSDIQVYKIAAKASAAFVQSRLGAREKIIQYINNHHFLD